MTIAPTSFGLFEDGDDFELLRDIEEMFGITVTEAEAEKLRSPGDLTALVEARLEVRTAQLCLLQEMLRNLRYAADVPDDLSPSMPLARLIGRRAPGKWLERVSEQSDLDLRLDLPVTRVGWTLAILPPVLLSVGLTLWTGEAGALLLLLMIVPILLRVPLPRRLPDHIRTVADLLRDRLHANFPRLRDVSDPGESGDRRRVLEGLCREIAGYAGPMHADTTFIQPR